MREQVRQLVRQRCEAAMSGMLPSPLRQQQPHLTRENTTPCVLFAISVSLGGFCNSLSIRARSRGKNIADALVAARTAISAQHDNSLATTFATLAHNTRSQHSSTTLARNTRSLSSCLSFIVLHADRREHTRNRDSRQVVERICISRDMPADTTKTHVPEPLLEKPLLEVVS